MSEEDKGKTVEEWRKSFKETYPEFYHAELDELCDLAHAAIGARLLVLRRSA